MQVNKKTLMPIVLFVLGIALIAPSITRMEVTVFSVTAASGSSSDIQAAINTVHAYGGGTVYIPEGNFTFNILHTYNMTLYINSYVGVLGYPGVNLIGAGINKTVLILNYTEIPDTVYAIGFEAKKNYDNAPIRISGISFIGHVGANLDGTLHENDYRCITLNSITDFRIDDCYFQDWASCAIETYNDAPYTGIVSRGVIDHCAIDNPYRDRWLPHNASAPQPWALWGYGIIIVGNLHDASHWDPNITHYLGSYYPNLYYGGTPTPMPVYIENCNFTRCRHAIASNDGGQYIARYCNFEKAFYGQADQHGGVPFGGRYCEVYGCTFNLTDESYSHGQDAAIEPRGGGGVAWNNTVILNPSYGTPTIQFIAESSAPYDVRNFYSWNNTAKWTNGITFDFNTRIQKSIFVENVNYFLRAPNQAQDGFTYMPYVYPHPFVSNQPYTPPPTIYTSPAFSSSAQANYTQLKTALLPHVIMRTTATAPTVTIQSLSFYNDTKKLVIIANGTGTCTLQIYCGGYGQPVQVTNATLTNYNSTSQIAEVQASFSEKTLTFSWLTSAPVETPVEPPTEPVTEPTLPTLPNLGSSQLDWTTIMGILCISVAIVIVVAGKKKGRLSL